MDFTKSILRKIDIFGVPYSFKYKSEERYTTTIGGFAVILFIILCVSFGIYYFIPFYNRKNFTAVYYTLSTANAAPISFLDSKTAMAFGLNCWTGNDGTTADQLFRLDFKYYRWELINNEYVRNISYLGNHPCTKKDFYNEFNETFDGSQIYKYQCLDDPSITVEGIWTSEIFSYFQFEVNAKNKSRDLLDKIDKFLNENDCKFQIYYSDNTIDIDDYKNPIKSYVEANFIQINPTLSIRRNIYFMNQFLYDDDQLIWVFNEEDEARYKKTFFSRFEEYSLFQGLKRENTSTDYLNFVKLYIRADTKKTEVKRTYEKFNEFFADDFSLLIVVYEVLNAVFEILNTFWKEQSLAKNIFFFQDFDHKLHINHKSEKIKELLQLTDPDRINNITLPKNTDSDKPVDTIQNFENEKIIYTTKEGHYTSKNIPTFNNIITQNEDTSDEIDGKYQKISNSYRGREYNMNIKTDISFTKRSRNNELCETNQFTNTNRDLYAITNNKDKETTLEDNDVEKVEYEYNLYEKIKTIICKCCLSKELKVKNALNEKAMSILDDKLDIVLFVRNMMLIDIINATLLDTETDDIVNFLARPIITLKDDEDDEFSMLYHKYKENDFEKFYKEIVHLSNKPNKRMEEIKLISICNKHLKSINI
jgi:hypothetical protein